MGKNQQASGLTNIIHYDNNGNITFVSGSTTLMSISSSGAITTTGVISGSNVLTASYANNAELLDGLDSTAFATTGAYSATSGSLYTVSSSAYATSGSLSATSGSLSAASGSFNTRVSALEVTGSALSSSILSVSSSAYATSGSLSDASGSFNTRVATIESKYATTGSNNFRAPQYVSDTTVPTGFANTTGSIYTDGGLQVTKDAYFSSSMFIKGNLTIYGTQSVAYITSSQLNIATNLITVNTATPSVRFGGLNVYDSGSTGTGATGSLLWDSQNNGWVYQRESGSTYAGGMLISGPRRALGSNLGDEQGLTACMIPVAQGGDHITSSLIYHDSTVTCIGSNASITSAGAACFASSVTVNASSTINGAYPQLILNNPTVGAGLELHFKDNGTLKSKIGSLDDINSWQVYNGGAIRLTINNSGNVGIGTSSPVNLLDVKSAAAGTYSTSTQQIVARFYNAPSSLGSGINSAFISIQTTPDGEASNPIARIGVVAESYGSNNGTFVVATRDSGGITERMRITSGGSVLIGTTTAPTAIAVNDLLVIGKSGSASNAISFSNGSTTNWGYLLAESGKMVLGSSTSSNITFETNAGTERMRITSAGVVGIGTNAPVTDDGNLVVAGCVGTGQGAANTVAQINIWETTSANKAGLWFGSMTNDTTGVIGSRTATGNIAFQTYCGGWAERMRIAYNGSVGIGTTITTGKVNIQQTINDSGLYFFNCASGTRFMFNHYCGSGINSLIIQEFDASNTFCRNIMAFASGGNVGIATASPSTLLQVSPGASYANNPTIQIIQSYADGYDAILSLTNCHTGGRNWSIRSTNNSQGNFGGCKLVFQDTTAGTHTSVMTLVAGGNVGIGTATPTSLLHLVQSTSNLNIYLQNTLGSGKTWAVNSDTNGNFNIHDTAVNRLTITSTGNVGIGTGDTGGTTCRRFEVYCATSGQTSNAIMRLTSGTNGAYGGETNFEFAFRDFGNSANYSVPAKIRAEYYEATGTDVSGKLEFYTKAAGGNDSCLPVLRMTISCGGNIGAPNGTNIYNASDSRLKRNVSTITCGINKVMALNPVKFNWIEGFEASEQDKDMLGFVAQEVQNIIPEAVENFGLSDIHTSQGLVENPLRVNEKFIIPVLVKAIQEQQCTINTLKTCLGIS